MVYEVRMFGPNISAWFIIFLAYYKYNVRQNCGHIKVYVDFFYGNICFEFS